MGPRAERWLDNPIFTKHRRTRLRRGDLLGALAVTMTLALIIVLAGYRFDGLQGGWAFGGLMMLQVIVLGFMGASQVGSSVSKARESGVFEFHRVSPLPAAEMAFGFAIGAPIREYVLFASTLPFSLICVGVGRPSVFGFFQLMVPLVLGSWVLHAVSLLNALVWKPSKGNARGLVGVILFLIFGGSGLITGLVRATTAIDAEPTVIFFGLALPWLVVAAAETLPAIGFLMLASTRKIAAERAPALAKPQAVACLAVGSASLLGLAWNAPDFGFWTLIVLYATILGAAVLSVSITPGAAAYAKAVLGASREGRAKPSAWSDLGLNRLTVVAFAAITLIAPTVAWYAVDGQGLAVAQAPSYGYRNPVSFSLPIAVGVFVVAYFGLALQYFRLRFTKAAGTLMALFVFVAWILPLPIAAISAAGRLQTAAPGDGPDTVSAALASLSPAAGIVLSSGISSDETGQTAVRGAAIFPAIVFAFLFNNLVVSTRRKLEAATLGATPRPRLAIDPAEKPEPIAI